MSENKILRLGDNVCDKCGKEMKPSDKVKCSFKNLVWKQEHMRCEK